MKRSECLQNMFSSCDYEQICRFLDTFKIYYQVCWSGYIPSNSSSNGPPWNTEAYKKAFYFYVPDNPMKSNCNIVIFSNTEEQVINKFERFFKLKAFL